ncbi:MAG: hemerythrin family protein [Alphaproteobacteria bacterium]|nr:hemerythrin family protein [Alphaproteobacteria bacterium]
MFEWDNSYKTGIQSIDAEHLMLFSLMNQIKININADRGKECVADILDALSVYASFHFANEKKLMETANFPEIDDHITEHMNFSRAVNNMKTKDISIYKVQSYLIDWLICHILGTDAKFVRFIQNTKVVQ